jgi:TRAP-type mannitol/chloroaromatic compound transport system permease large subunit
VSYLKLSRYALLACVVIWICAMVFGELLGESPETLYLAALVSGVLLAPLAMNVLVAQFIVRPRDEKVAKYG